MSLSLCMIVKNEQDNLPRCLESVKDMVDEMIVVDTGSTDSTIEIAEGFGADVHHFSWNGSFSDARNYSMKHAACDWILIMDADDQLDEPGRNGILRLINNSDADAYYLETINYIGNEPGMDKTKNMNIRLIRNNRGYFYTNSVHEQIHSNILAVNPSAKIIMSDIKVYHYGYLNENIKAHNKRERNITLLKKELEDNPGYPFALFNLGSEYYAMGENQKAIEYFEESYKKFYPKDGFSSHLVIKMVNCYANLGRYDDALRLCNEGLLHYPEFTELEYMKGIIQNILGNHALALKHFKRCIEMGEAPNNYSVIVGVGTFRACFMLGEMYFELEDYDSAIDNYKKALDFDKQYNLAFLKIVTAYCIKKYDPLELKEKIEELRKNKIENFDLQVFDILIQKKYYDLALKYIEKYNRKNGSSPYSIFCKGMCMLFLKKYHSAYRIMDSIISDSHFKSRAACAQALCRILQKKYLHAAKILTADGLERNDILVKVYLEFINLLETGNIQVLSDDEKESSLYTVAIFDILKILIVVYEFELFEKALYLLNTVNDKTVLLKLAKLYYNESCYKSAYQELIRSIKIFDLIDPEGSKMLHKLKYKGF